MAAVDRASPVIDAERAETAFAEHLRLLGLAARPVRWTDPERAARLANQSRPRWDLGEWREASWKLWHAVDHSEAARWIAWAPHWWDSWVGPELDAWRASTGTLVGLEAAAFEAARTAEWAMPGDVAATPEAERWLRSHLPLADAAAAGLWLFCVLEREVLAVSRPALRIENDRLHCAGGPAVFWPDGARYYFLRGVQLSEQFFLAPESLTPSQIAQIAEESNLEARRVMLEQVGPGRFLKAVGATKLHVDDYGTLWRAELEHDEPLVMVEVLNATPDADGAFRDYFLRVPPTMRAARQAVAWSFGYERPEDYSPSAQT